MKRVLIIPAAGKGTRLGHDKPKFLYPLQGKPLIQHVLDIHHKFIDEVIIVVSPDAIEIAAEALESSKLPIRLVVQHQPSGMLDAILLAADLLNQMEPERIWITWCDQVAIREETLIKISRLEDSQPSALIVPMIRKSHPYIHFVINDNDQITNVLQRREGDCMPEVGNNDIGLFSMSLEAYRQMGSEFSQTLQPGEATRERNFLPFIPWFAPRNLVITVEGTHDSETIGINTPEEAEEFSAIQFS